MSIQLGDFGDIDFSATQAMIDKVNAMQAAKSAYQSCAMPAIISDFMSGSYVNGVWTKKLDLGNSVTRAAVDAYESCGDDKLHTLAALVSGTDPDKVLTDDQVSANLSKIADIDAFAKDVSSYTDYLKMKYQVLNGMTTPQASNKVYQDFFNSFSNYSRATQMISKESAKRGKNLMNQSTLTQSTIKTAFQIPMLDFYSTTLQKYGSKFSQDEQQQLHQFFVSETPLQWTVDEFLRIGTMLKGRISAADWGQFAVSVLGTVSTSTFEDPGGGMSSYLKRAQDFSDALLQMGNATMADLPTASVAQSKGISLPMLAAAGVASYLAWKALK